MTIMIHKSLKLTFLKYLLSILVVCRTNSSVDVSPSNTLVWGPAFNTHIVLPVRYFFIHAVDSAGNKHNSSVGDIKVEIYEGNGNPVRAYLKVLDRQDGSYIARFRHISSFKDLKINVLYKGKHVAESPYSVTGQIYQEKCYCPVKNLDKWMKILNCPKTYQQIKKDLASFNNDYDMEKVSKEAFDRFSNKGAHSLAHYSIVDNKVYRRTHGQHVGFKMFMDAILLSLVRKVNIPDVEFLVNLGDWPLQFTAANKRRRANETPLPIFSWCGSDDTLDIIMPTYDITESTLESMNRVTLDLMSVQAHGSPPWEQKIEKGFFRGRDSRRERLDLVKKARQHPDLIDAALTNFFFFKDEMDEYGPRVDHISFMDFFKYKYQLNIDGTVAAYRFPYLMSGDSVVLKQDSPYYEHFYHDLKPWKHYIPLKRDLSDVLEKIQWAKDHDEEAKEIGRRGQQYVREYLQPSHIFCYHAALLKEFAKKLSSKPKIYDDMELVEQPTGHDAKCDCKRLSKKKKSKDEL